MAQRRGRCFPPPEISAVPDPGDDVTLKELLGSLVSEVENGSHPEDFTVYTGQLGISCMYLSLSRNESFTADERGSFAQRAFSWFERSCNSKPGYRGGISYILGSAGLHALGCALAPSENAGESNILSSSLVSDAKAGARQHATRLRSLSSIAQRSAGKNPLRRLAPATFDILSNTSFLSFAPASEILFGQAGYIYAALHANALLEARGLPMAVPDVDLKQVAEALVEEGRRHPRSVHSQDAPLSYSCFGDEYLGAAHGTIGVVYVLLHTELADLPEVRATVDFIAAQQFESGNFPAVLGERGDHLVHWCHGAPGAVFLFCCAYHRWGDAGHLRAALSAGECTWRGGLLRKGVSLCHGIAGNGYAFLRLWRTTRDPMWLARARSYGLFCARRPELEAKGQMNVPDNPLSLFEGIAGAACFVADLLSPDSARFPGFELS